MHGDNPVALIAKVGADLLEQMLAKRARTGCRLVQTRMALSIEPAVAAVPQLGLAAKINRAVSIVSPFRLPMLGCIGCEFPRERLRCSRRGRAFAVVADIVARRVFP